MARSVTYTPERLLAVQVLPAFVLRYTPPQVRPPAPSRPAPATKTEALVGSTRSAFMPAQGSGLPTAVHVLPPLTLL